MKKILFYIALTAVFPLFWNGKNYCKEATNAGWIDTNLIYNTSFEFNAVYNDTSYDLPSDTCWVLNYMPSNPGYSNLAPPSGGGWSLGLIPSTDSSHTINADYYIKGINGTNNYTLNFWWKVIGIDTGWVFKNAFITAGKYSANVISQAHTMIIPSLDTAWTHDSISFSLTTGTSDTIVVRLSGGITRPSLHAQADGLFLFDKVQLIKQ